MPRTPDRYPGVRLEEGVVFEDTTTTSEEGELRYVSGSFQLEDSIGAYDPRTVLPTPTAEGAMFYSDDGLSFIQIVPLVGDGILVSDTGKIVYEG